MSLLSPMRAVSSVRRDYPTPRNSMDRSNIGLRQNLAIVDMAASTPTTGNGQMIAQRIAVNLSCWEADVGFVR